MLAELSLLPQEVIELAAMLLSLFTREHAQHGHPLFSRGAMLAKKNLTDIHLRSGDI
jgi:hypothetical protein